MGRLLAEDEFDPDAEDAALETVLSALEAEWKARKGKKAFKDALEAKANLVLRAHDVEYGGEASSEVASKRLGLAEESVATVFAVAGRRLGNGLHLAYLKRRSQARSSAKAEEIKLELATLADDESAVDSVDITAKAELDTLMAKHRSERKKLPPDRRGLYDEIQRKARDPELAELVLPTAIQLRRNKAARTKHLFANGKGRFPGRLNTWESRVIDEELKRDEVVAWLRNIDRKDWALCVPYEYEGRLRALYPDLIVFRKVGGEILVDILDPHRHDLDDAWAKAKGLAQYAAKYGADHFGRVQVIAVETDTVRRIELNDEKWRKKALKLDSNTALKELYGQAST